MKKERKDFLTKKSQAWSMDIMIAVLIFLGTIFLFFAILNITQSDKADDLKKDASIVIEGIVSDSSELGILNGTKVSAEKLGALLEEDYDDLKRRLRIKNDFCIYFEDDQGNIIYINKSETKNYTGVGSNIINVSGVPCN